MPSAGIAQPQPGQMRSLPPAGSSGSSAAGAPRAAHLARIAVMIRVRHGRDLTAAPRAARRDHPTAAAPPRLPCRQPCRSAARWCRTVSSDRTAATAMNSTHTISAPSDRAEDRRDVGHAEADAVPHHQDRQAGAEDDPGQQDGAGDAGPAGAGGWGCVGGHGLPHCARTAAPGAGGSSRARALVRDVLLAAMKRRSARAGTAMTATARTFLWTVS